MRERQGALPTLDESLEHLQRIEQSFPTELRVAETRRALEANARLARDRARVDGYYACLGRRDMFRPIYGMGSFPHGLPVALPGYLVQILDAAARVLLAFMRDEVRRGGPQYLIDRLPAGWLTEQMAERLHGYYLTTEPDLAFDVLVHGSNARRGVTFDELLRSGDHLHAKLLEAQSVDTYYGWWRDYLTASRQIGLAPEACRFTLDADASGRPLDDAALDRATLAALNHPCEADPGGIVFVEVDPEAQPSGQNLVFMADAMAAAAKGGAPGRRPLILDPRDLEIRDGRLYATKPGVERELTKVISRIVDVDLEAYVKARRAEGAEHVIERFRQLYALPHVWGDLAKHLCGFYLVNKSMLSGLGALPGLTVAGRTRVITPEVLEELRRDPAQLDRIAMKPLLGMSAKGVTVTPTLAQVEDALAHAHGPILAQDLICATPILPDINEEIADPDVRAGVCCEARLLMHGGSPAIAHDPHRARVIGGLSRSHYQSADPKRRIKGDGAGRGWYSNMGAILAVKKELGLTDKVDAGVGMAPIYWLT